MPWLYDASASVECEVDLVTDYGTHSLFIGRVQQVHCAPTSTAGQTIVRPLVWLAGRYEISQVQTELERDTADAVSDIRTGLSRDVREQVGKSLEG